MESKWGEHSRNRASSIPKRASGEASAQLPLRVQPHGQCSQATRLSPGRALHGSSLATRTRAPTRGNGGSKGAGGQVGQRRVDEGGGRVGGHQHRCDRQQPGRQAGGRAGSHWPLQQGAAAGGVVGQRQRLACNRGAAVVAGFEERWWLNNPPCIHTATCNTKLLHLWPRGHGAGSHPLYPCCPLRSPGLVPGGLALRRRSCASEERSGEQTTLTRSPVLAGTSAVLVPNLRTARVSLVHGCLPADCLNMTPKRCMQSAGVLPQARQAQAAWRT